MQASLKISKRKRLTEQARAVEVAEELLAMLSLKMTVEEVEAVGLVRSRVEEEEQLG